MHRLEKQRPGAAAPLRPRHRPSVISVHQRDAAAGERVGGEPAQQADALAAEVEPVRIRLRAAEMEHTADGGIAVRESAGKPNRQHLMTGERRHVQPAVDRQRIGIGR